MSSKPKDRWGSLAGDERRIDHYFRVIKETNDTLGAFLSWDEAGARERLKASPSAHPEQAPLTGVPFGVKDNISLAGQPCTCGSKMLADFVSPYNAAALEKLLAAGAVPVGKTNLDEFGMGSSTENSALGTTVNPWDAGRVAGGSSGGSAAAVAAGQVPFALGSDTGGSVRQPAAFCGCLGLKPTYGTVSRYGLVAYASSLEVIGILAESVEWLEKVLPVIQGQDSRDNTSVALPQPVEGGREPKKIGVLTNKMDLEEPVREVYEESCRRWEALGYELVPVEIPSLDYVIPAYYTIAAAEASANLARFNGIRYGHRYDWAENPEELIRVSRDEGFGAEVKNRILLGTFVLRSGFQDQYYTRAQKIRTAIRQELAGVFQKAGSLFLPVFPVRAFKRGEAGMTPYQQKLADLFTATANLAGLPALSFPCGEKEGLPVGMQLMAPEFQEGHLMKLTRDYLETHPFTARPGLYAAWDEGQA